MRKYRMLVICLCMLMFAGCGRKEDAIDNQLNACIETLMWKASEIKTDENYTRYEQIAEDGKINEEGLFYTDEVDYSTLDNTDAVYVTFATNSYITVQYFGDSSMTCPLDLGGTYLNVNDCIYADIQKINNPNTNAYEFSGYEIWEFDENGEKQGKLEADAFDDGRVFRIPADFKGKEISIVPIGKYISRNITLDDYCKDNNGVEKELTGTWDVNGEDTTETSISISPVDSCTVIYRYDPDMYVFVGSEPVCLVNNEEEGTVSFEEFSANEDISSFSVELRKKDSKRKFDSTKYQVEHADIQYVYQGAIVNGCIDVSDGGKIEYEITHIDEGYWISGDRKGEVDVDDVEALIAGIVCEEEKVRVTLPQPEKGGTISYFLDGEELSGESVETLVGAEIKMTFQCKNGWTCSCEDGTIYKVGSQEIQTINVDGIDVNDIFTEQQYKPTVTLTIDKSVGTYTEFEINTVDVKEQALRLETAKKSKEVFNKEVGTKNDLMLSASGGALLEGEALKVEIKKETWDAVKETDVQYLQKLPGQLNISLYIENSSTIYKTVKVTVSKVNVVAFSSRDIENGKVTIETADLTNNRYLGAGDVIESSRKVKIAVSANDGYYIKDSGKTEIYTETMKYSKYVSDVQKILDKHPVKKLCNVTLDVTDAYGTVTYKIDGKSVINGTYGLKEEQKLEMVYEITDGKHIIVREGANWIESSWNKTKSKTKETVEIPITNELDGNTVKRETYIHIKDK